MLTQIDVIYEGLIPTWSSQVTYAAGKRVVLNYQTYEALVENTNVPPTYPATSPWTWLGSVGGITTPVTEEAALALPILGVSPKNSLLIRKVTGLNPPDVDLFIGDYARDGGTYQGRRVGNRNVVLTMDLNPNPALGETISGLRDLLYKTFVDPLVDADHLELVLRSDDGRVRNMVGYTEKFETEIFDIETMAQISLLCPDPYIRDVAETVLTNTSGIWVTVPFTYGGTAEIGFYTQINISANTSALTIRNNGKTMVFNYDFLAEDVVYLDTQRGQRSATVTRGGVTTPLLAYMTTTSSWLELHSQVNTMSVYGVAPTDLVAGVKILKYRAAYWGV